MFISYSSFLHVMLSASLESSVTEVGEVKFFIVVVWVWPG